MFKAPLITLVCIFFLIGLAGCGPDGDRSKTIVLYGFSSMENVMKEEIIPSFQRYWKETTGEEVKVITSFAGSGTITNQIVFGAPAQIAMVATELDASNIKDAGMTKTDWASFKNQGTYAYTITLLVTRQGNPKGVHSFYDAAKPGVDIVHPDPTTSGGAQWAILALYGSTLRTNDASTESGSTLAAVELLTQVSSNAGSLPESARRALTQFALGYGDALLTYENEALLDVAKGHKYEIIVPVSTILVEPKVMIVDRNVNPQDQAMMRAFVDFLWDERAQAAFAENHFRVWDESIMAQHSGKYPKVELPFTVEDLGGWNEATSNIIESTWRQIQREIS